MRFLSIVVLLINPVFGDGPADDIPLLGHESYMVREASQARLEQLLPDPDGEESIGSLNIEFQIEQCDSLRQIRDESRYAVDPEIEMRLKLILARFNTRLVLSKFKRMEYGLRYIIPYIDRVRGGEVEGHRRD